MTGHFPRQWNEALAKPSTKEGSSRPALALAAGSCPSYGICINGSSAGFRTERQLTCVCVTVCMSVTVCMRERERERERERDYVGCRDGLLSRARKKCSGCGGSWDNMPPPSCHASCGGEASASHSSS